jgi:hypothetical protein
MKTHEYFVRFPKWRFFWCEHCQRRIFINLLEIEYPGFGESPYHRRCWKKKREEE